MNRLVTALVLLLVAAAVATDHNSVINMHIVREGIPHKSAATELNVQRDCDLCPSYMCRLTTCGECIYIDYNYTMCIQPKTSLCITIEPGDDLFRDISSAVCVDECDDDLQCFYDEAQLCANCAGSVSASTCVCSSTGDDCEEHQCSYDNHGGPPKCFWITIDFPFFEDVGSGECVFDCDEDNACEDSKDDFYCSTCHKHGKLNDECQCDCKSNYYGDDCGRYCLASDTCTGHGSCDGLGRCGCDEGYSGKFCDEPTNGGIALNSSPITVAIVTMLAAIVTSML